MVMVVEKIQLGEGRLGRGVAILKRMVRKEYPKMLSFKQIPERSKS